MLRFVLCGVTAAPEMPWGHIPELLCAAQLGEPEGGGSSAGHLTFPQQSSVEFTVSFSSGTAIQRETECSRPAN